MRFTLNGEPRELTVDDVRRRLHGVTPEPVRQHGVRVDGIVYPVKQAFEAATGVPRSQFISHTARRHLADLGFEIVGQIQHRDQLATRPANRAHKLGPSTVASGEWHTEAAVQSYVVAYLVAEGWRIFSVADTASHERGVDILASREHQTVAVEVKGFPSRSYVDPVRADEQKRTHPSTQARHWYAQVVLSAMLNRSRQPTAHLVIALPDFPTYRDLYARTADSLRRCQIDLWWVTQDTVVRPAPQP